MEVTGRRGRRRRKLLDDLKERRGYSTVDTTCRTKHQEELKVKVKESRNRPGVTQTVPGGLGSQISMTFGT